MKWILTELTNFQYYYKPKKLNKAFDTNYKKIASKGSDFLSISQHLGVVRPHLAVLLNRKNNESETQLAE